MGVVYRGVCVIYYVMFFFFKQKTAYEMRISDLSSDVCSSDLSDNSLIVKHGKPPHFIAIPLRSLLSIPLDETEVIRVDSNCDIDEFIIALFHCECIAKDRKPILTTTPTGLIDKP